MFCLSAGRNIQRRDAVLSLFVMLIRVRRGVYVTASCSFAVELHFSEFFQAIGAVFMNLFYLHEHGCLIERGSSSPR